VSKLNLDEIIAQKKLIYAETERGNEEIEVIRRYGQIFSPKNLDHLTKDDFTSFLHFKNNKHWKGIYRQQKMITEDMEKLRNALKILLDENKPLKERLDILFPKNKPKYVKGLGRAVTTPILLVVYPKKYGVYNGRTEEGIRKVGLEPDFSRDASFSEKYIKINEVLNELSAKHDISLFALDEVWWEITK
jgi:hypothetical protein